MKRQITFLTVFSLLSLLGYTQGTEQSKSNSKTQKKAIENSKVSNKSEKKSKVEIVPITFFEKITVQGKSEYWYYLLSQKRGTSYRIEGPGKLSINCRISLIDDNLKSKTSSLKIIQSDAVIKTYKLDELSADTLKEKNTKTMGYPTKTQKIEMEVPPGKHTFKIFNTDDQNVSVRLFYSEYPKPIWEDIIPVNQLSKSGVRHTDSKKALDYYILNKKSEFKFTVTDSLQLRILARPIFENKMLDDTKISIGLINQTNGVEQVFKFTSGRSNDVEFVNDPKNIPGRLTTFYLTVPKSKRSQDVYTARLISGAKSVVVRISKNKRIMK